VHILKLDASVDEIVNMTDIAVIDIQQKAKDEFNEMAVSEFSNA